MGKEYERVKKPLKNILIRFSKQRETIIAKDLNDFLTKEDIWVQEAITQILSLVEVKSDDQSLPHNPYFRSVTVVGQPETENEFHAAYREAQQDMLTPDSEGVWVKVKANKS